ncbi:50S ribosomal protein L38e [Candidatus Bathyarchaeota archaeon]|nr:50S ribosomal protein L38e [Candidatus Bathyarchaeota archaeon]
MPTEIFDVEKFLELSERAKECRVRRKEDVVKLKLRLPKKLYTLKASPEEAENILSQISCELVEV